MDDEYEPHFDKAHSSDSHSSRSIYLDLTIPEQISIESPDHWVTRLQNACKSLFKKYKNILFFCMKVLVYVLWFAYLLCACVYNLKLAQPLIIITILVLLWKLYVYIRDFHEDKVMRYCCFPIKGLIDNYWDKLQWWDFFSINICNVLPCLSNYLRKCCFRFVI